MSTFTVITGHSDGNGRNWLEMTPGHFDTSLLPRKHRKPEPDAMFSVADLVPSPPKTAGKTAPQLDGQGELFGTEET